VSNVLYVHKKFFFILFSKKNSKYFFNIYINFKNENFIFYISIFYFYKLIDDLNPSGLSNVNSQFQIYSYNTILDEMYLTNRTLPQYLITRYDAQNFGTGNYSLLNYRLNIQNIVFFYTSAFGLQLLIAFVIYLIFIIFKYKFNKISLIFLLTISIFLISPIEEVNSFYGILLGFCAAKLNTKITEDE